MVPFEVLFSLIPHLIGPVGIKLGRGRYGLVELTRLELVLNLLQGRSFDLVRLIQLVDCAFRTLHYFLIWSHQGLDSHLALVHVHLRFLGLLCPLLDVAGKSSASVFLVLLTGLIESIGH